MTVLKALLAKSWSLLPILLAGGISHASLSTTISGQAGSFCPVQSGTSSVACTNGLLNLRADADYGNLSATASGPTKGLSFFSLYADSNFADTLVINGITSGFVSYTFVVTGQATFSDAEGLFVDAYQNGVKILQVAPYNINPIDLFGSAIFNFPGGTFTTVLAPFTANVPFSLTADSYVSSFNSGYSFPSDSLDVVQATLTGISIFDASKLPVTTGVAVYSNSSTYDGLVTDTATPEPSMMVLLFLALVGLVWAHRRRSGQKTS